MTANRVGEVGAAVRKSLFDKGLGEFASNCRGAVQGRFGGRMDFCQNDRAGADLECAQGLRGRLAVRKITSIELRRRSLVRSPESDQGGWRGRFKVEG